MKKWIFILTAFVFFFSCTPDKTIPQKIRKETKALQSEDVMGDGSKYYNYQVKDILLGEKVKGIIDKELNVLPTETKERQIATLGNNQYDHYTWDTPKFLVKYEFKYEYPDSGQYEIKVWITKK